MTGRSGYRGYIGSRPYQGNRTPQSVQNLVVRDYCQRNGFSFLLSATEYAMENCFMIMEDLVLEAPRLEGVVLYSLDMLPTDPACRHDICRRFLDAGCTIHGAVENTAVRDKDALQRLDEIWFIRNVSDDAETALKTLLSTA